MSGPGSAENILRRKLNCGYNLIREGEGRRVAGGREIRTRGRGGGDVEARGADWVERLSGGVLKTVMEGKSHSVESEVKEKERYEHLRITGN